ncbi:hypothetical protein ACFV08_14820, partial [Streptomyces fradiae]
PAAGAPALSAQHPPADHFGARDLHLAAPTAALGVKQSGVVLKYVAAARDAGLGVVLITHNPHHAYLVGDRFVLLKRGAMAGSHTKESVTLDELTRQMAGGSELDALRHELERTAPPGTIEGGGGGAATRRPTRGAHHNHT